MNKNRLFALLLGAMMFVGNVWATAPKREFRSAWIATVANIDWPSQKGTSTSIITQQKNDLTAMLDRMVELNMTTVCFQVRSMSDALYESSYEPWADQMTGTRGQYPGWDPLAFAVEECHKRGIEIYAWVNPFRWSNKDVSAATWNTSFDQEVKSKGWLLSNGSYTVMNPALPDVRAHIVKVCKEIITKYSVEGMIFDDYFYPSGGMSETSSAADYALWKSANSGMTIGDWRRSNVNTAIKEIYDMIQEVRPEVRFGIAPPGTAGASASKYGLTMCPAGYDGQYNSLYADPLYWMANHIIDFISPQVYWHNDHKLAKFGPLANWWYGCAAKLKNVHCSMSVNIYDLVQTMGNQVELGNTVAHYEEHVTNIKQSREYAAALGLKAFGSNLYSIKYLCGTYKAHGAYLAQNCFQTKALVPVVDWKTAKTYSAVNNLTYSNGTLSWNKVTDGLSTIRYSVYAVPSENEVEDVQATDGDGIDSKYLVGVTYNNTFTVPSEAKNGYWYAVCVYDGYGNEHEAAFAGYSKEPSQKVSLISPVNGVAASWSQVFSWSAVTGATYRLEISDDQTFATTAHQEFNLTSNTATVDLSVLESGKTYYWRVLCTESGKQSTSSDVASFKASTRTAAPAPVLVSPSASAKIESDVTFSWKTATGVETYTLEISTLSDFSSLKISHEIASSSATTMTYTVHLAQLPKGTYYWRVKASGKYYNDTYSTMRPFEVTKEIVGQVETGYTVTIDKDNESYETIDNMIVNSLWYRSVAYGNISFEETGSFNRSMCVSGDYVYLTGRSANTASASIYLRKFNGRTGEHMGDIALGSEAIVAYNPCNDIFKDSYGNVCISNLVLSPATNPLKVHMVNLETGALTEVASVKCTKLSPARIDNVAIWGNVATGNFKLYAVIPSTNYIYRWTFVNGVMSNETYCTVKATYPAVTTASLGIAPRIVLIGEDDMFVDGGDTAWSRYNFNTGEMTDSFDNNTALAPSSYQVNGGTFFEIGGKNFVTYTVSDWAENRIAPQAFNVVSTDDDMSFASMSKMWTLPKSGLGNSKSTGQQAVADYVKVSDYSVILYYYLPGNGLCAYEIINEVASGIKEVSSSEKIDIKVSAGKIEVGAMAQSINVYSVMGTQVAHAEDSDVVECGVTGGLYIVVAVVDGKTYTKKVLVK